MNEDRRRYLRLLGGALAAGTAGCLGGDEQPATEPSDETPSRTATGTPVGTDGIPESGTPTGGTDTATPAGGRFLIRPVAASASTPIRVYPDDLRADLREAATGDDPVRSAGSAFVYTPHPPLTSVDTVELVDPDGDADGVYTVDCQGGTRYELLVGAEATTPPTGATVTPVSDLADDERAFVDSVIEEGHQRVSPETERGEWVRTEFFESYVEHDGTTYRGYEVQQTDAEFFSTEVWYVLELTPVTETAQESTGTETTDGDGTDPVTLDLAPIDPAVRGVLDPHLGERTESHEEYGVDYEQVPQSLATFCDETDRILTHDSVLALDVER